MFDHEKNEIWLRCVESGDQTQTEVINAARDVFGVTLTRDECYHAYQTYGFDLPGLEAYYGDELPEDAPDRLHPNGRVRREVRYVWEGADYE